MSLLLALVVALVWAGALALVSEMVERDRVRSGGSIGGSTAWGILLSWLGGVFLISLILPVYAQLDPAGQDMWDAAVLPMTLSTLGVGVYAGVRDLQRAALLGGPGRRSAAWATAANAAIGLGLSLILGPWPTLLGLALTTVMIAAYTRSLGLLERHLTPVVVPLPRGRQM